MTDFPSVAVAYSVGSASSPLTTVRATNSMCVSVSEAGVRSSVNRALRGVAYAKSVAGSRGGRGPLVFFGVVVIPRPHL